MKEKVLVGLSGGADSAYCAKTLIEKGFDVTGVYLLMCGGASPDAAKKIASELGIPLIVSDRRKSFEKKIEKPFCEAYASGKTPNPCVECNAKMKFAALFEIADRKGIKFVATGHYAGITEKEGRFSLVSGLDEAKDQSYFLWKLPKKMLPRIIFPLSGTVKKEMTAGGLAGSASSNKESMDICFIPDKDTGKYLAARTKMDIPGDFVDKNGKVLGTHKGIIHYTVGQRRGLGVSGKERYFVTAISPEDNTVTLGVASDMITREIRINRLNFVSCEKNEVPGTSLLCKCRSRMPKTPCSVKFTSRGAKITFFSDIRKVSPGQSVAVYSGKTLLFGGKAY